MFEWWKVERNGDPWQPTFCEEDDTHRKWVSENVSEDSCSFTLITKPSHIPLKTWQQYILIWKNDFIIVCLQTRTDVVIWITKQSDYWSAMLRDAKWFKLSWSLLIKWCNKIYARAFSKLFADIFAYSNNIWIVI